MRIVYGRDLCNAAMKYGLANEEIARKQYEREYSTEVKICGLFVDKDKPFLCASPDGLVEHTHICKTGSLIRSQLYEELQKLIVSADRRCLKLSYNLFSRHTCFNDCQKTNGRCWRAVGRIEAGQSIPDVAIFFGVHHSVIPRLWKQFQTTQTVVRRVTTSTEDQYITIADKRNRRVTSTRVTSMITASIGKAISAATARRRLHKNGLYARVHRVCVPLSVQSRGALLKWCREHGNWTVSNWGTVMFTDESRFALEAHGKRIRIWRKQGTRNHPKTSPNITHS
ncbi:HTH_Tnp_Tc3_2 domain-containing protein [Trichonephila clavipes]|nr:HTH_Tnp_Tc3_2 domain-containing protein [Trichonephila clavipes]